jgi:3-deoxy-manno-octulosonate cytidylyltransferase (CMP-KDO synthetase)
LGCSFHPSIRDIGYSLQNFSIFFAGAIIITLMNRVLAIIPARFASSRFPGKMLAQINGKTLIQHTYENAQRCKQLDELVVATDDPRIAEHVASFGGKALLTSESCRTGTDRAAEAISRYRELDSYDIIVNLQGDEPTIDPETVGAVVERLLANPEAAMATAATPLHCADTLSRSSVVKCVFDRAGYALYFSRAQLPVPHRAQVVSYRHIGLYVFRRKLLLEYAQLQPTPLELSEDLEQLRFLESGYRIQVAVVDDAHCGIDTPADALALEQRLQRHYG